MLHVVAYPLAQRLQERKCVREDASVGGNFIKPISHTIFNVIAYACVLTDTLSFQEDMTRNFLNCKERKTNRYRVQTVTLYYIIANTRYPFVYFSLHVEMGINFFKMLTSGFPVLAVIYVQCALCVLWSNIDLKQFLMP